MPASTLYARIEEAIATEIAQGEYSTAYLRCIASAISGQPNYCASCDPEFGESGLARDPSPPRHALQVALDWRKGQKSSRFRGPADWDQASKLAQLSVIDQTKFIVKGIDSPHTPSVSARQPVAGFIPTFAGLFWTGMRLRLLRQVDKHRFWSGL